MNDNRDQLRDGNGLFDIGILFVHGIGAQSRGQTLTEFGGPVHDWLVDRFHGLDQRWHDAIDNVPERESLKKWRTQVEQWADNGFQPDEELQTATGSLAEVLTEPQKDQVTNLVEQVLKCDTSVGRASLLDTVIEDPNDANAPAHSKLRFQRQRVNGALEEEQWLLAESWWAETFAPPGFSELAQWGFRIIPGTVGNHFGAQVARVLADRSLLAPNRLQSMLWTLRLLASFLQLFAALLLSPFLVAAFAIVLILGLIPIPQVRQALLSLQLKLAASLGDSFVLVTRPIEAASIVGQVRRDLKWLAKRCKAVVVVGHSQGGAVAHKAVQEDAPTELQLLFTFGSGLKKLEELKFLLSSGHSYRRAAVYSLYAALMFVITLAWFVLGTVSGQLFAADRDLLGSIAAMTGFAVASMVFLVAGIRDHLRGINLPMLNRWVERLKRKPFDWVDCFASADPVSNGILIDDPGVEERSVRVCNSSSTLKDHTSYWQNRDQFLTLLIDRIVQPNLRKSANLAPVPELQTGEQTLDRIAKRRQWRVGISNAIGWIAFFSVLLVCIEQRQFCWNLIVYWLNLLTTWSVALFGGTPQANTEYSVSWPTVGYLTIVLIPYWVSRRLWRKWNETEMYAAIDGRSVDRPIAVAVGIWAQLLFAFGFWYGDVPPGWLFFVILAAPMITIVMTEPSRLAPKTSAGAAALSDEAPSDTDKVRNWLQGMFSLLTAPFAFGLLGWNGLAWISEKFLGGSIFGIEVGEVSSLAVGAVVALIYGAGVYLWRRI